MNKINQKESLATSANASSLTRQITKNHRTTWNDIYEAFRVSLGQGVTHGWIQREGIATRRRFCA